MFESCEERMCDGWELDEWQCICEFGNEYIVDMLSDDLEWWTIVYFV